MQKIAGLNLGPLTIMSVDDVLGKAPSLGGATDVCCPPADEAGKLTERMLEEVIANAKIESGVFRRERG